MSVKDAWRQAHELFEKFTQRVEIRPDLSVTAHACDRSVEVAISKIDYSKSRWDKGYCTWHTSGQRNVSTMRELAQAILEACDFVEASNPTWASLAPAFPCQCSRGHDALHDDGKCHTAWLGGECGLPLTGVGPDE